MPDPILLGTTLPVLVGLFLWWLATRRTANWILCSGPDIPCACCRSCQRAFPLPFRIALSTEDDTPQEIKCGACGASQWNFIYVRSVRRLWQSLLGSHPILSTGVPFDPAELGVPIAVPLQNDFYYNPTVPLGEA